MSESFGFAFDGDSIPAFSLCVRPLTFFSFLRDVSDASSARAFPPELLSSSQLYSSSSSSFASRLLPPLPHISPLS